MHWFRACLPVLFAIYLPAAQAADVAPIDLASTAGFERTCARVLQETPVTVQEQQAYVICNDVALVQHLWTFVEQGGKEYQKRHPSDKEITLAIRMELRHARDELRKSRAVLEKIRLGPAADGLLIKPATWVRDLNGDGEIGTAERYFFALPRRRDEALKVDMPSDDADYYAREYNLDAAIRLDQTDIYWAVSYHYYAEALIQVVLSYQYRATGTPPFGADLRLVYPENMRQARQLLAKGLRMSEKMRQSALAETDDDHEWLNNPRQHDSAFPVPLDAQDFTVWAELLRHLTALADGRTLLTPAAGATGPLDVFARACAKGKGFSLAQLFLDPPPSLFALVDRNDGARAAARYCRPIDREHPASGLAQFIATYAQAMETEGSAGLRFLRRLLWVN